MLSKRVAERDKELLREGVMQCGACNGDLNTGSPSISKLHQKGLLQGKESLNAARGGQRNQSVDPGCFALRPV